MTGDPPEAVFDLHWKGTDAAPETKAFTERLVLGAARDSIRIDDLMRQSSLNWRIERMATVDRNVIRLAVYEILNEADTPAAVVINEAIEIAKKFGGEESAEFVNGVLDAVRKGIDHRASA